MIQANLSRVLFKVYSENLVRVRMICSLLPPLGRLLRPTRAKGLKKILSGLRADGEDGKQVEALTQFCELLSIGTEDSLNTFYVDSFVPVLVGLLNHESNPDIMLLATRAIAHLVDVLPSSCAAVVHYGVVNCFCARLLTIEYMNLAEQVSWVPPSSEEDIPRAPNCLFASWCTYDSPFLSRFLLHWSSTTAANMCKKLPSVPTKGSRAESIMSVHDIAIQSQPLINIRDSNKVEVFEGVILVHLVVLLQSNLTFHVALITF